MDISIERRVPAARAHVWQALLDPETMRRLLPGCARLQTTSANDYELAFADSAPVGLAGLAGHAHVLEAAEPERLRFAFEGEGTSGGFTRGETSLTLTEADATTVLRATLLGHGGGAVAPGWNGPEAAQREMALFLDRLVMEFGGMPASPVGADGPVGAMAAAMASSATPGALSALLAAIPPEPLGFPRVAWIGGAVFVVIFFVLFSSYVL